MEDNQASSNKSDPKRKSASKWIKELSTAEKDKEYKKFLQRGRDVTKRYMAEAAAVEGDPEAAKYNVFWSNIGVLKAALYANSPKPVVKREFDDYKDQAGRVASIMMERLLRQPFDEAGSELNETFKQAVEDRLLPGLGQVWLMYKPTTAPIPDVEVEEGEDPPEQVVDEEVETKYLNWEDFIFSPCRTWKECRWAGQRVWMEKDEFEERFGEQAAAEVDWKLKYPDKIGERLSPENFGVKKTEVFEIWCKTTKKVYFVSKSCEYLLEEVDDPLDLDDFFPCPRPLLATHTTSSVVPKADYMMVQSQYIRLQDLTIRIKMLEDAIQASGVYDKANKELSNLLNGAKTNRMIPVDNWAYFAEKGGIKGVIDWFPLEMIVDALDKLRELKNEAKAELYELTGISDIMRGVSAPRETAMAQGLKAQYSSVRLQYIQEDVAVFVQNALRIKGEIIAKHFEPETIIKNSLIELTPDREWAQEAAEILKNDWGRIYRVQIYADTLSIPDYNAERQGRIEFITASGQFISQIIPLVQMQPAAAPFLIQILQWGVASFRSAQSIEGVFTKMLTELEQSLKQPQQPKPDPALIKANADVQAIVAKTQAHVQSVQKKTDATVQSIAAKTQSQIEQDRVQAESQAMQDSAQAQSGVTQAVAQATATRIESEARVAKIEAEAAAAARAKRVKGENRDS